MATTRRAGNDLDRSAIDYDRIKDPGHGNTPAAWMGVFLMLVGSTILAFGIVLESDVTIWTGVIFAVAGPVVGLIMRAAGKGKPRS